MSSLYKFLFIFAFCNIFILMIHSLSGEIKSCQGWRLNSLPEVKKFLLTSGYADTYENLTVTIINGMYSILYLLLQVIRIFIIL